MKPVIIFACFGLLISNGLLAHEGHDHGLSKNAIDQQMREGKLCVSDDAGSTEGAVIEKEGKIYRCVKAYGKNLEQKTELVWIELKLEGNSLRTLP
jgi:hypothetical protein